MPDYNNSHDFSRMQEEALSRLRDMQRRSRNAVNNQQQQTSSAPSQTDNTPPPPPPQQNRSSESQTTQNRQMYQPQNPSQRPDILRSLFGDIKIDSEKALILLMLFVLYKNKADIKLLLALGYLLI